MPLFYLGAQDEGPYLIRLHVVEVEGNIGAFIQANRESVSYTHLRAHET